MTPQLFYEGIQIKTDNDETRNYLGFSFVFNIQETFKQPNKAFFEQVKICLGHYLDYLFPSNKTFKEQILQNILPKQTSQLIQQKKHIANINIQEIPTQVAFLKFRLKRKIDTQDNKQKNKKLKF